MIDALCQDEPTKVFPGDQYLWPDIGTTGDQIRTEKIGEGDEEGNDSSVETIEIIEAVINR
jgi:hypothetical protein